MNSILEEQANINPENDNKCPIKLNSFENFNKALEILLIKCTDLSVEVLKILLNLIHFSLKLANPGSQSFTVKYFAESQVVNKSIVSFENLFQNKTKIFFAATAWREFSKIDVLLEQLLSIQVFQFLKELMLSNMFEISSEAFETSKALLLHKKEKEKIIVVNFLKPNYEEFLKINYELIKSENQLSRRESLKTLHEFFEDKINNSIVEDFINQKENLILVMTNLKSEIKGVYYQSLLLLETFLKNYKLIQNQEIKKILLKNKQMLMKYIKTISDDQEEDYKAYQELILHELDLL